MNTNRSISELSADTLALESALMTVAVGATVTYRELSAVICRDVQGKARSLLTSARRRVLRDQDALFEPVVRVGLKRLDDIGKVQAADVRPRIRRIARRGRQKAASVTDFDALPNDVKVSHNMLMALLGAIDYAAQPATGRKLEAHIGNAGTLPTVAMLDLIKETL